MKFDTAKIRTALKATPVDLSVEDIRKVRDKVNERIKSGEIACHICTSAQRVFGDTSVKTQAVEKVMDYVIGGRGGVMEHVVKIFCIDYKGAVTSEAADKLRQEVMKIWVDMKRNRKGNRQPKNKPVEIGSKVIITNTDKGSGSCEGRFFKIGDTGVVISADNFSVSVKFDRHTVKDSTNNTWSVKPDCLKVI
jgi:hypothetical protein